MKIVTNENNFVNYLFLNIIHNDCIILRLKDIEIYFFGFFSYKHEYLLCFVEFSTLHIY
jgi:hypothetical protein